MLTQEILNQATKDIEKGGKWLCTARSWMQHNIRNGDTLMWNSTETVHVPFFKLEELSKNVAIAAVAEDRLPRTVGDFPLMALLYKHIPDEKVRDAVISALRTEYTILEKRK